MDRDDSLREWFSLPRRIYLDSSTLQTVYEWGGVIWEEEPFEPTSRAMKVAGFDREIDALRLIFLVNQRAQFEFVVTEASIGEVAARNRPGYTQWVYDVLDTWLVQSEGEEPPVLGTTFSERRFGNLSAKDRRLLQDALDWRCAAFMTMERRLTTAAAFIERTTGLRVMRPSTYWATGAC